MKLQIFFKKFSDELQSLYSKDECNAITQTVFEKVFQLNRIGILKNQEKEIIPDQEILLQNILSRLLSYEPLQYVLGEADFYGMKFLVNKHVLIPRPETEELVDWVINCLKNDYGKSKVKNEHDASTSTNQITSHASLKILDIGTGSGCIAISLKKKIPDTHVYAMDISDGALHVAKENADINKADVNFYCGDIFKWQSPNFEIADDEIEITSAEKHLPISFDVIVSNPPYIKSAEKNQMHQNVLKFEPHHALFVDDNNPLIFYEAISDFALKYLNKNGLLFFEINQQLANDVFNLLSSKGLTDIEVRKDMSGNYRMVKAVLK